MCSTLPSVVFFFGLSGAGKNFVAEQLHRLTGWPIYDADDDITPEMKLALAERRPFTPAMRDRYFPCIVEHILERKPQDKPLVVTQAVYKQRHRDYLCRSIPGLMLVWVDAPDEVIRERLKCRNKGIEPASAAALRADFERPVDGEPRINNDSDGAQVAEQLMRVFEPYHIVPVKVGGK